MSEEFGGLRSYARSRLWSDFARTLGGLRRVRGWNERLFARQYVFISGVSALIGLFLIAAWVDSRLRAAIVNEIARTSSWFVEDKIQAIIQELRTAPQLSNEARQELSKIGQNSILGRRLLDLKIWSPQGRILFSSDAASIGTKPAITVELQGALAGRVASHFDDHDDLESAAQRRNGDRILEIYFPIYSTGTKTIIAVAEVYLDAMDLVSELSRARIQSLFLVGTINLALLVLVFGIVRHGNSIISEQNQKIAVKHELEARLLEQNSSLARAVREAQHRNVELSDQILRQIGADLHDGPAQLLSVALLRLGEVSTDTSPDAASPQRRHFVLLEAARRMTQDALTELRGIAKGLVLPQLGNLHAIDIVKMAIADHKQRTQTEVSSRISLPEKDLPLDIKTCIFRCIQEGLNNAFRHAGGREQFVGVAADGNFLVLTIKDAGPGLASSMRNRADALGIAGLRNRVEALGGQFEIQSSSSTGTSIVVKLALGQKL